MEKRGSKHSARVSSVYAGQLVGWNRVIGSQSDMEYVQRMPVNLQLDERSLKLL
jgi:hypothetical protein